MILGRKTRNLRKTFFSEIRDVFFFYRLQIRISDNFFVISVKHWKWWFGHCDTIWENFIAPYNFLAGTAMPPCLHLNFKIKKEGLCTRLKVTTFFLEIPLFWEKKLGTKKSKPFISFAQGWPSLVATKLVATLGFRVSFEQMFFVFKWKTK